MAFLAAKTSSRVMVRISTGVGCFFPQPTDEIRMTASSRTRRGDRNRYGHARRPQDGCATEEFTAGFRKESFAAGTRCVRSEVHTSELQSRLHLVCRLLLEKKK